MEERYAAREEWRSQSHKGEVEEKENQQKWSLAFWFHGAAEASCRVPEEPVHVCYKLPCTRTWLRWCLPHATIPSLRYCILNVKHRPHIKSAILENSAKRSAIIPIFPIVTSPPEWLKSNTHLHFSNKGS